jgi:Right handed beta helix region
MSRTELGSVPFALASFLLMVSCLPQDAVEPATGPGVKADLSSSPPAQGFYVSPSGSPSGDGSASRPWDLQTALNQPATVQPGDTIWLRGGTYSGKFTSNINGTGASPIIVRQYPGERAKIDGGSGIGRIFIASGSYTWFWGFEVMSSSPTTANGDGILTSNCVNNKFINLVVHDAPGSGIANWTGFSPRGGEISGNIIYNNGLTSNQNHGMYIQNDGTYTLYVTDNIIFNNLALGISAYGSSGEYLIGFDVEGNVVFDNGMIDVPVNQSNEILIGGGVPASHVVARNNYTFRTVTPPFDPNRWAFDVGYTSGAQNVDVIVQNNYLEGGMHIANWTSATVTGNTAYDYAGAIALNQGNLNAQVWNNNTFYGDPTAAAWAYNSTAYPFAGWETATGLSNPGSYAGSVPPNAVFVRPNKYEAGRANIIVYNWANLATVNVDLSEVLSGGESYVIRNVQDFFGTPVVSGTYTGGTVSLPMAGVPAPVPIGRGQPGPVTGPTFNVFVVLKTP